MLKAACEGKLVSTEAELSRKGTASLPSEETRDASSPCPDANKLLARILAERRAKWEAQQWTEEIEKAKYKEPQQPDTSELPQLPEG